MIVSLKHFIAIMKSLYDRSKDFKIIYSLMGTSNVITLKESSFGRTSEKKRKCTEGKNTEGLLGYKNYAHSRNTVHHCNWKTMKNNKKAYVIMGKYPNEHISELIGKTKCKHHKIYVKGKYYERNNKKSSFS